MTPNPTPFIDHLKQEGYHPRSDKHSNALCEIIVDELLAYCPQLAEQAAAGKIVYDINFDLISGTVKRNVDLVVGAAPLGMGAAPLTSPRKIIKAKPSTVHISIEIKAVMTEHRKAVKNRMHDFDAHHAHAHQYNKKTIAGGVLVLNASPTFQSPLRDDLTVHKNPEKLIQHCISEMRSVLSSDGIGAPGLDAKAIMVVNCDNVNLRKAKYETGRLAPTMGDPLHFDSFINTICELYKVRFL